MSEYIVQAADWAIDKNGNSLYQGCEEIVRCRDCKHGHEATWPVSWNLPVDYLNCFGYLVTTWDYYNDEPKSNPVPPDGFCAWGERR